MIKITIYAALEKKLRADQTELAKEVVALIDQAKEAREVDKGPSERGTSYRDILVWFNAALGPALALPPNPSSGFIVRLVNRAREIGLDADSTARLCAAARKQYPRPPYDIEFLLRNALRFLHGGDEAAGGSVGPVVTGRPDFEE